MSDSSEYTLGSSNVFADLGLPLPEEYLAKAQLAAAIHRIISARKLSPAAAAEAMDLTPSALTALRDGRLADFSLDRLMNCLRSLEQDVTISVRPATQGSGRILVKTG
jgi:predicted XRE-type DNA-binding protein